MSERTTQEIRGEIAAERQRLEDDLDALHGELRPLVLVPFLVVGVIGVGMLLRGRGFRTGAKLVFRFL